MFIISIGKESGGEDLSLESHSNQAVSRKMLILSPVLKSHDGQYICEADNGVEKSLSKLFSILVHGRRIKIHYIFYISVWCETFLFNWLHKHIFV